MKKSTIAVAALLTVLAAPVVSVAYADVPLKFVLHKLSNFSYVIYLVGAK